MEKDKKQMLYNMYNATSTDDGTGNDELESYENWLERQLLSRIEKIEQLDLHNVSNQRELLLAFLEFYHNPKYNTVNTTFSEDVDMFLANNCG